MLFFFFQTVREIGSITHNQPKFLSCTWPQNLLLRLTEGELNLPFNIGEKETVLMLTETREGTKAKQKSLLPGESQIQRGYL